MRSAVAALAVLALTGCSSSSGTQTVGKYDQTWSTPYMKTTCTQWFGSMTAHQRFVAAHDLADELGAFDKSDRFARSFARDISKDCAAAPTLSVDDVAASIATIATGDFN